MKKLFLILIAAMFLMTGCGVLNTAVEITDILTRETPVHSAMVQSITIGKDKATLFFEDGFNYEVRDADYIKPGDKVNIFETKTGFRAEMSNEK